MDYPHSATTADRAPIHGIGVEDHAGLAHVWFDRAPVNAFDVEMLIRFQDVLRKLAADKKPVLVAGRHEIFSAGFDIKGPDADVQLADELARKLLAQLRDYPGPVVAAVEGAAVGLGLLIATSADLLVVSRSAALRMPEVTLGLDTDTAPLERFLPTPWIRRLCLTGVAYTPEDMHLAAVGVSVCDPRDAVAVAETAVRQFEGLDSAYVEQAKHRLRVPHPPETRHAGA